MIYKKISLKKFNFQKIIKAQTRCLMLSAKAGVRESQKMMSKTYPKLDKLYVKKLSFFQIKDNSKALIKLYAHELSLLKLVTDKSHSAQQGIAIKDRQKKMAYEGRKLKFIGLGRFVAITKKLKRAEVFEKKNGKMKSQDLPGIFCIVSPKKQDITKVMTTAYDLAFQKAMEKI